MATDFASILSTRLSRRGFLGLGASTALAAALPPLKLAAMAARPLGVSGNPFALSFKEVTRGNTPELAVAEGYRAQTLIRWGDPVLPGAQAFTPQDWTAAKQSLAFGFNNDFTAYLPLQESSRHGLLHVNHEYTIPHLMFPGLTAKNELQEMTDAQMQVEQAAHGFSVIEVKRAEDGSWSTVPASRYARRATAYTPMKISGPAAGHVRLRTAADPQGRTVLGTLGNCAGGVTPWGTVLVSEENFDGYFGGETFGEEAKNHERYTVGQRPYYAWHRMEPRFDLYRTPNEPNRFGWVVEYDPYDPLSQPVKRTALGRFKHETATCALAADGRLVVYSGDDDYFEYIYRFVSSRKVDKANRAANANLLDDGTLYVAQFEADGKLRWLALRHGENNLTPENGFHSQADVLIEARRAGDVAGATKMDRPEGIAIYPHSQAVFVSLTRNPGRDTVDAANPRLHNKAGHLLKLQPPSGDHAADVFAWDIAMLAGDPAKDKADYGNRAVSENGWFANPDNLAFHPSGSLWVCTDGLPQGYGYADGLFAADGTTGPKAFLRSPTGAEVTGPSFTPDGETLFLSIQHPGDDKHSTFDNPSTRWPDFDAATPPRSSVLAITRER